MQLKKNQIVHLGLDDLEIYFHDDSQILFRDRLVDTLNDGNNNQATLELSGYKFMYTLGSWQRAWFEKSYKFSIAHDQKSDDLFMKAKPDAPEHLFTIFWWPGPGSPRIIKPYSKIVFHSTFFAYEETYIGCKNKRYDFILNFIETNFRFDYTKTHIHRFDIACDVILPKSQLIPYFEKSHFSGRIAAYPKDHPVNAGFFKTDYIGVYNPSDNRRFLCRLYDKKDDTWEKGKTHLFPELEKYDYITRIEYEIRPEGCLSFTGQSHAIDSYGKNKILSGEDQKSNITIQPVKNSDGSTTYRQSDWTLRDVLCLLEDPDDYLPRIFHTLISKETTLFDAVYQNKSLRFLPYEKYDFDLKEVYDRTGFIPDTYMTRFVGYSRKILECTGYDGYIQAMYGQVFHGKFDYLKENGEVRNKKWLFYTLIKDPTLFIDRLLAIAVKHYKIDRYKLNTILQKYMLDVPQPKQKIKLKQKSLSHHARDIFSS